MYYQYPLKTMVRSRSAASQLQFARRAKVALADSDELLARPGTAGLALFAANESALDPPARILRELYGDFVELRPPVVRVIPGEPAQEPVMNVRVVSRKEHAAAILAEVRRRGARVDEECIRGRTYLLRAEAPLALLLGLPAALDRLTGGGADSAIRLARYAPLPQGDGPEAA
ncbi:hypothetical protein [Usitatibacter palustris]|uniref:Elongation factor EFG domain-containing protein n=1 Tax=Usitatibacter palustris TaxID=2732487 RepID=A0A6M4H5B6_9PROT|nr:hypothetical protein [Usitatibacter palustris]QJR14806.1 hypothetical protein DSM104440_01616 [Usitatibacter palustris]